MHFDVQCFHDDLPYMIPILDMPSLKNKASIGDMVWTIQIYPPHIQQVEGTAGKKAQNDYEGL